MGSLPRGDGGLRALSRRGNHLLVTRAEGGFAHKKTGHKLPDGNVLWSVEMHERLLTQ